MAADGATFWAFWIYGTGKIDGQAGLWGLPGCYLKETCRFNWGLHVYILVGILSKQAKKKSN